jgi:hypothetical protein
MSNAELAYLEISEYPRSMKKIDDEGTVELKFERKVAINIEKNTEDELMRSFKKYSESSDDKQ